MGVSQAISSLFLAVGLSARDFVAIIALVGLVAGLLVRRWEYILIPPLAAAGLVLVAVLSGRANEGDELAILVATLGFPAAVFYVAAVVGTLIGRAVWPPGESE